jgi:N-acetylglutamate synthase
MIDIVTMTPADIDACIALWTSTAGMVLRDADSPAALVRYLERNPGCSFVAHCDGELIGVCLAGHDGRRGYLNHVAVAATFRRQGIGKELVLRSLAALKEQGIGKCHLFVYDHNESGKKFWAGLGWQERANLRLMSMNISGSENA